MRSTKGLERSAEAAEIYEIHIKGYVNPASGWFDGMEVNCLEGGETRISGPVADQAALHGLLMLIRDLNLPLLSVLRKVGGDLGVSTPLQGFDPHCSALVHDQKKEKGVPKTMKRRLGRSGLEVSALGLGCWAIGGPFWDQGWVGYGDVDDAQSIAAVHRALELGVNFFDTADAYGCGRSERVLGQALVGQRNRVVLATKFGNVLDEQNQRITGVNGSPAHIRQACEASLRRLNTDYIDLYQFHLHDYDLDGALEVRDALEGLVQAGKIRWYGWSLANGQVEQARLFAGGAHCTAVQFPLHMFVRDEPLLAVCDELDLASINQGPLGRGLLTGKFNAASQFSEKDMRRRWGWSFQEGFLAERLQKLEALRSLLTRDGRSLAQAALGWVWAVHPRAIPIPGFKGAAQVEENAGALAFGPLEADQVQAVAQLLWGQAVA